MQKLSAVALLALALLVAVPSFAQGTYPIPSTAFTFGPGYGSAATCSVVAFPDYSTYSGWICLNQGDPIGGYGSYLDVPFQLGYLNNGYLAGCNPLTWQPKVFTVGDGTHNGDVFSVAGATTCPYYTGEYGTYDDSNNRLDGFNVVANYVVIQHRSCYRGRCTTYFTNTLQNGTGEVVETLVN